MEATFNGLLEEARRNFNEGESGKGKKGSLFRKCHSYWAYANRTFINGSHATVHELSCYHRPEDRSNQAIEASNKHKNMLIIWRTLAAAILTAREECYGSTTPAAPP